MSHPRIFGSRPNSRNYAGWQTSFLVTVLAHREAQAILFAMNNEAAT